MLPPPAALPTLRFLPALPARRSWRAALLLAALAVGGGGLQAQIVAWDFNGKAGNESSVSATTLQPQLNPVSITRGSGLVAMSLADSFAAGGWDTANTTLAAAQAGNQYLAFSVSSQSGSTVSYSTIDANFARTAGAPNQFQWQYSLDGFATPGVSIGSTVVFNSIQAYGQAQGQISLSGISALQSVASSTTVEFRLYAYGATSGSGMVSFGYLEGNDLAIGGTVGSAIPEPATYAWCAGVAALSGTLLWRRRPQGSRSTLTAVPPPPLL
jgi:hypothetical protein